MKKKNLFLLVVSQLSFLLLSSQVFIEVGSPTNNRDAFGSINVYGSGGLSKAVPYNKIKGSTFWKPEWQKAYFFNSRDTALGSYQAKFNFGTQEVHFLNRMGEEQAAIPGELSRVIFMKVKDSTEIETVFRADIEEIKLKSKCKSCFVQELNQGDTKLLKIIKREVRAEDSLFGILKKYYFVDKNEYFIQTGDQFNFLKKLSKDEFFTFIPGKSAYDIWIREKKFKFINEEDYLVFLAHYNATHKKD